MAATIPGTGSGPGGGASGNGGGSGSSGGGVTPPSPASSQKNDPLSSPHAQQYPQYPSCPLTNTSHSPSVMYNNNMGGPPSQGVPSGPQVQSHGPPGVHNSYSLTPEGHVVGGQVSPGSQGGGGPQQGAPQAQLPSPLYPWMRSQFGKNDFDFSKISKRQLNRRF
jgi:hypothetical protein